MNYVNKEVAFRYLTGIEHLFDTLAKSFLDSYKDFENKVSNSYEIENFEELYNYVHSLKGITLNLGMEELYSSCVDVLSDIRFQRLSQNQIKKLLDVFGNTYTELTEIVIS